MFLGKKFWYEQSFMDDDELFDLLSSITMHEFDAGALMFELESSDFSSEYAKNMTHNPKLHSGLCGHAAEGYMTQTTSLPAGTWSLGNMSHSDIIESLQNYEDNSEIFLDILRERGLDFYFPVIALLQPNGVRRCRRQQDGYRSSGAEIILSFIDIVCQYSFEEAYKEKREDIIRHIVEGINPPVSDDCDLEYARVINGNEYRGDFMVLALAQRDEEMIQYLEDHGYSRESILLFD